MAVTWFVWLAETCRSACSIVVIPMLLRLSTEMTVMASAVSALVLASMLPVTSTRCVASLATLLAALAAGEADWAGADRLNMAPARAGTDSRIARRSAARRAAPVDFKDPESLPKATTTPEQIFVR